MNYFTNAFEHMGLEEKESFYKTVFLTIRPLMPKKYEMIIIEVS